MVEFFGEAWVEAFCPQHARALSLRSLTHDVTAGMGRDRTRRPLVLAADAGVGVQRATAELAEHAGEELALVEGLLEMQHPPAAAAGPARRTPEVRQVRIIAALRCGSVGPP